MNGAISVLCFLAIASSVIIYSIQSISVDF